MSGSRIRVSTYFKDDSYVPRLSKITKSAILNNGLLALMHGWYKSTGALPDRPAYIRDGGHCLTLQAAYGILNSPDMVYLRDPGSEIEVSTDSQSTFASNRYFADGVEVCLGYGIFCSAYTMTVLTPDPPDNDNRFLDGAILVATKGAYTFSDDLDLLLFIKGFQFNGANPSDVQSFPDKLLEYFENVSRYMRIQPTILGGYASSEGGSGGAPPGGFVGYLPQARVSYDTTEAAISGVPASGMSLVIT